MKRLTFPKTPKGTNKAQAVSFVATDGAKLFNTEEKLSLYNNIPESNTTDLEDITATINTDAAKVLGYMVLNTTTGVTVFASGATDNAVWHYYDSTTAHTPV